MKKTLYSFFIIRDDKILFLLGVLACVCKWDPIVFPKFIVLFLCSFPVLYTLFFIMKKKCVSSTIPVVWYTPFVAFVVVSLLYTVNKIDATDVVRRCVLTLGLSFSLVSILKTKDDCCHVMKGFVFGAIATLIMTFIIEISLIGSNRLGCITCGSSPAFSNILLIGFFCSLFLASWEKKKEMYVAAVVTFMGIVLSGSRMPLILALVLYAAISLMKSSSIKRNSKKILFLSIVFFAAIFVVMNNSVLYNIIGFRLETMMESFLYGVDKQTDASLESRKLLKENAMIIWRQHPFFGSGVNSFWVQSPFTVGRATSHCGFTEILCSFGVVGFVLFYWPFVWVLFKFRNRRTKIAKLASIVLIVFFVREWQSVGFQNCCTILFCSLLFWIVQSDCKIQLNNQGEMLVN